MTKIQRSEYLTVEEIFGGRRKQAGEVGIEIEVEGRGLPQQEVMEQYWSVKRDGSLRGESAEYVLTNPVVRRNIRPALAYLETVFNAVGAVPDMSYRTSVHIHVNQQGVNFNKLITEMVLYYIFEESLVNYCGPERIGNKFCLRARDAEDIVRRLYEAVTANHFQLMTDENIKYAAMNINALARFNSLEFRAMRGTLDRNVIDTWIGLLLSIKDAALSDKFSSPADVVGKLSEMGTREFTLYVFGPQLSDVIFADRDYHDHMYYGMRLVQELAYGVQWNHNPEEIKSPAKKPKKNVNLNNFDDILRDQVIRQQAQQANVIQPAWRPAFGDVDQAPLNQWGAAPEPPPQRIVEIDIEPEQPQDEEQDF